MSLSLIVAVRDLCVGRTDAVYFGNMLSGAGCVRSVMYVCVCVSKGEINRMCVCSVEHLSCFRPEDNSL